MLRFHDVRKSFGGHTVLNGISGEIQRGDVILLRGENGSGKTTLLNILTGCLEPDAGAIEFSATDAPAKQSFHFPRPWYRELNPFQRFTPEKVARLGVGRTWQDIRLFPSLDLTDNIAAASPDSADSPWAAIFRPRRTDHTDRRNRRTASDRLAGLGLTDRDDSSGDKISFGQSKRVAIARAIETHAKMLFLDEPLSGLDADGIRGIVAHLRELAVRDRMTLVIVEHALNIPYLLDLVNAVWTLRDGTLLADSPAAVELDVKQHGLGKNIHDLIGETMEPKHKAIRTSLPGGASLTSYLPFTADGPGTTATPVMETRGLQVKRGFRHLFFAPSEGKHAPEGISFTLPHRTISVLEAPNGWGKSSLLECIIGTLRRTKGDVLLSGRVQEHSYTPDHFFNSRGRALLSTSRMFPSLTVAETSKLTGCEVRVFDPNRSLSELSGGELRQLSLLSQSPGRMLIVDEFTHSLDGTKMRSLFEQLVTSASMESVLFLEPSHSDRQPLIPQNL